MKTALRLDQIQGNITPGFRKNHQAFMLLRFSSREAAGAWLRTLAPSVTSARDVWEFVRRLKRAKQPSSAEIEGWRTKWVNVALSWDGLEALGAPGLEEFPDDFKEGLRRRAVRFVNDEQIERWQVGGTPEREAHALVVLAADTKDDLEVEIARQSELARIYTVTELATYRGAELHGDMRGHEHFGYRDGISQPDTEPPGVAPAWGEFILGHANQVGALAPGPRWARHGSYAVFRRLKQDVAGFRHSVETQASRTRLSPEELGAKLVGRSTSGAKLTAPGAGPRTPPWSGNDPTRVTAADFERDPHGEVTPHFAHIRKSNPRAPEAQRHRLIRRGIPYGPELPRNVGDDGLDRGLLFLAYQASLSNQFEHVQREWLNNAKFPAPLTGRDPVVGQGEGANELIVPMKGGSPASITLGQFVKMTGGGYFFSPSIETLTQLARVATREAMTMADDSYRLGDFILKEDPYNWKTVLPGLSARPVPSNLEQSYQVKRTGMGKHHDASNPFDFEYSPDQPQYWEGGLFWNLGDTTVRISKAVRIEFEYNGIKKGLVIGFEGSGGGM